MSEEHMGSSIDEFLKEEGIFEEADAQAMEEVVAWKVSDARSKADQLRRGPSRRSDSRP
jgi:hypothetical protein